MLEKMQKSILYPNTDPNQSQNLTDWSLLKLYHSTKFGSNLSTIQIRTQIRTSPKIFLKLIIPYFMNTQPQLSE